MSAEERAGRPDRAEQADRADRADRAEAVPRLLPPTTARERLRASLSSRAALRDAFLLQEVLGPPLGLRRRPGRD